MFCPACGLGQPDDHRFCISCGAHLPGELLERSGPKLSRWFPGIPVAADESPLKMLRVSRYLEDTVIETAEGSVRIPSHHVRFSIWMGDRAVASVSIPEDRADELVDFLSAVSVTRAA